MKNKKVLSRLLKIQELIDRGVGGEKDAAIKAYERVIKAHNLTEDDLTSISTSDRVFTYSNLIEQRLLLQIMRMILPQYKELSIYHFGNNKKRIQVKLNHLDYIEIETTYEYFRRHMKAQYKIHVTEVRKKKELELIERHGKVIKHSREFKSYIRKLTKDLQDLFFTQYIIKSKFYTEDHIVEGEANSYNSEALNYMQNANIKGGVYNKQVTTGLYLN